MKAEQLVLVYGLSTLSAGLVSWLSGKKGAEIARDALVGGAASGTVLLLLGVGADGQPVYAQMNSNKGMGSLSQEAIGLLENIDADHLYQPMKRSGVKVAAIPANPSVVLQDAE